MQRINVPFDRLEKVAHMADIHIRLFKRHAEYRKTFAKLYKELTSVDLDNGIILVAGDILHAKLDLSPESVALTSDFFKSLANIAPTVIFDGNHDLNLANPHRMRSLQPILDNLNHPNLHYLVDSGVYRIADTDFALFSVGDSPDEWPSAEECTSDVKVALYHGPVYGAMTDTRFTITSRRVHPLLFKGYDIAMLGDIHKHQVLHESDPKIVYPSSLIQQNHGESYRGHGWCYWDIPTKSFEFKELIGDYGYVTLEVEDGKKFTVPDDLPDNLRLRLFTGGLEASKVKKILAMIKKKYRVVDVSVNARKATEYNRNTEAFLDIGDLTDINIQNELIRGWLTENFPEISEELMEKILEVNSYVNENITYQDYSRNIEWRPLEFEFSNLFSFGEGNRVDFSKLEGTHGIFAANATGKSSSMEALIYTLFDKTPRAFRGDHIMNNRKNKFHCHLKFEVNGTVYHIVRDGKRKSNGAVKVDVDFWKEDESGDKISLNGENRYDTNANIRARVGTYEDFILTSLSAQKGASLFIDKSNTERKTLLNQFMGLIIFEYLYEMANDESREIQGVLKKFTREDFTGKLAKLQVEIEDSIETKLVLQTQIDECGRRAEDKQTEIETLSSRKVTVPVEFHDPEELAAQKTNLIVKVGALEKNMLILQTEHAVMQTQLEEIWDDLESHDMDALKSRAEEYESLRKKVSRHVSEVQLKSTMLDQKNGQVNQLSQFKYNPDCEVCVENNQAKLEQIRILEEEISTIQGKVDDLQAEIATLEGLMDDINPDYLEYNRLLKAEQEYDRKKLSAESHRNAIDRYQNQIDAVNAQIEDVNSQIELTLKYQDQIIQNAALDQQISAIRVELEGIKDECRRLEDTRLNEHGKAKVLEDRRSEILRELKEISELEREFEAYKYYMEVISRNGLPYDIISKAIPNIEAEINNILSQIAPFTIALDVDGKNFGGRIIYDVDRSWPLENSSGMEAFISSLAIRVALLKASNLPKSNFLIVDEGMGTLDSEYLHGMQLLFDMLKDEFEFIIIISHLDNARDMVDNIIEITQKDGFSYISN